ncbi:hypothetical protein F6V30_16470 [Oryzomonas sagensis]|uniref:Uncharacterized protein n=2 Tax=Oryzomonas sagensis TaxID=2603857 RepID=A0ABQ6TKP5_9BACT|nr:hypothetical protein F6V30_16470 [Oryzomonas sagensis]
MCATWPQRSGKPAGNSKISGTGEEIMVKTATFEALLEDAVPDGKGGYIFTLEGKSYTLKDKDEVRGIAESHGYIIIY